MKPRDDSIHGMPLVHRLIEDRIGEWLQLGFDVASDDANDEQKKAIDSLKYLHLSGYQYGLVPRIVDDLRRAGLLVAASEGEET